MEFTAADVIAFIQEELLQEKYGIFVDGEAIACILELEQLFFNSRGMEQAFVEIGEHSE